MFNPILIIAMPSGEELLKEILMGSTGYKKKQLVKLFCTINIKNIATGMKELKIQNI